MTHTMNVTRTIAVLVLLFVLLGTTVAAHGGSHSSTSSQTDALIGKITSGETIGASGIILAVGIILFLLNETGRLVEIRSRFGI